MTIEEISTYLQDKKLTLDEAVKDQIKSLKTEAIVSKDESVANILWCYQTIYGIQFNYLKAYENMHIAVELSEELDEQGCDSPKSKHYEGAWNELDQCDMEISSLEENFSVPGKQISDFHITEIEEDIQKLFPLFPYRIFTSRETIIKRSECSICGRPIDVRHSCGHKVGKLYMGEICHRNITDLQFLNINIVSKPFDRYAIMKIEGKKFNFEVLDYIIPKITPYSSWSYIIEKD